MHCLELLHLAGSGSETRAVWRARYMQGLIVGRHTGGEEYRTIWSLGSSGFFRDREAVMGDLILRTEHLATLMLVSVLFRK